MTLDSSREDLSDNSSPRRGKTKRAQLSREDKAPEIIKTSKSHWLESTRLDSVI